MRRRRVLRGSAVLVSALGAGCSAGYGIDDALDWGDTLHEGEERLEVSPETYETFTFELERDATLEYNVTVAEGPPVDVILLDDENYPAFERSGSWDFYPAGTSLAVSDDRQSTQLVPGSYNLVVDNSGRGGAAPTTPDSGSDGTATVETTPFQLTAVVDFSFEVVA